jgi:ubiquinone biosynthesis monooxygenase Coq7
MVQKIRLPGDKNPAAYIDRLVRVNQAGEYGAKRIYQGQLAALKGTKTRQQVKHMLEQELVHLKYFDESIPKRRARPSILSPVWHVAGFALGYVTGKIGKEAAMACTVAIEEVIGEHYQEQLDWLQANAPHEKELIAKITKFRDEELEHRDTGIEEDAEQAPCYSILHRAIQIGSKVSIWIAKRF